MPLYYLKETNNKYVYDPKTKRLFRVIGNTLKEMMMCDHYTYRITMPLSGHRFRVTICEIEDNMLGDISPYEVPVLNVNQRQFQDDFEYGSCLAIKNNDTTVDNSLTTLQIANINTNGAYDLFINNDKDVIIDLIDETVSKKLDDFLADLTKTEEVVKSDDQYYVCFEEDILTYEQATKMAKEMAIDNTPKKIVVLKASEVYNMELFIKKV